MASIKEILVLVLRVIDSIERLASAQERLAAAAEDANKWR